jgi:hypothetical protein
MAVHDGYELCECPEHGTVCAKRSHEHIGGESEPMRFYECPGVEGDTGGCNAVLEPLGETCERPSWAEYVSD